MPHVLVPLLRRPDGRFGLRVRGTADLLATRLELAFHSRARRRGLMGRLGLDAGEALVLAPCGAIHTAFMRFAIDVVFLARNGRVIKVATDVPPWRVRAALRGFAVVEMAAGSALGRTVRAGDVLEVVEMG